MFVGVPLVIETELIYASRAVINWYVSGELVSKDNRSYTPKAEDVGKSLSVLIVPTRPGHDGRGCEEAYRFKNLVEPLPWMPIVSPVRDGWTQKRSASERDDLRVLTYNILADLYTSRDVDQHLMYAHCDLSHLMRWRRMPMLIYEILAYNADVICLQEVDTSIYDTLLRPVLESKGYQGFYSNKASTQQEGCAMFWSTSCFEEVSEFDMKTISIRDLFAEHEDHLLKGNFGSTDDNGEDAGNKQLNKWNSMDEILDLMGKHDELRRIAREKTGQILQVANLTLKNPRDDATNANAASKPKRMILANTHLFYHPMADHIRAMQAYVVCKKIDEVRRQDGSDPYPLVLCGDLNSDPLSGAVQLLFTRAVDSHHETWKHLHDYRWAVGIDAVSPSASQLALRFSRRSDARAPAVRATERGCSSSWRLYASMGPLEFLVLWRKRSASDIALMVVGCSEGRMPVEARRLSPPDEASANNLVLILTCSATDDVLSKEIGDDLDGKTNADAGPAMKADAPRRHNDLFIILC